VAGCAFIALPISGSSFAMDDANADGGWSTIPFAFAAPAAERLARPSMIAIFSQQLAARLSAVSSTTI
jgi:hypothetical protein